MSKEKRIEAAKAGQKQYDGRPCKHGHPGRRFTSNNVCVDCNRIWHQQDKAFIRGLMDQANSHTAGQ